MLKANFEALDSCNLTLQDVFDVRKEDRTAFLNIFIDSVLAIALEGYNEDCSGNEEIKAIWTKIRELCFKILEKSLNLLFSDNIEILQ